MSESLGTKFGLRDELVELGIPKPFCRLCCLGISVSVVVGARDVHRAPEPASLSVF